MLSLIWFGVSVMNLGVSSSRLRPWPDGSGLVDRAWDGTGQGVLEAEPNIFGKELE